MNKPEADGKIESKTNTLTHLNEKGEAHMVDIGYKANTERLAVAHAIVKMNKETIQKIANSEMPKGDVLAVVRTAGIMAAKKTPDLIPLCHPLMLSKVSIEIDFLENDKIIIRATTANSGQTGVEMEALTAASVAALTLYDMCKAIDRGIKITEIALDEKTGGKSGIWKRKSSENQE